MPELPYNLNDQFINALNTPGMGAIAGMNSSPNESYIDPSRWPSYGQSPSQGVQPFMNPAANFWDGNNFVIAGMPANPTPSPSPNPTPSPNPGGGGGGFDPWAGGGSGGSGSGSTPNPYNNPANWSNGVVGQPGGYQGTNGTYLAPDGNVYNPHGWVTGGHGGVPGDNGAWEDNFTVGERSVRDWLNSFDNKLNDINKRPVQDALTPEQLEQQTADLLAGIEQQYQQRPYQGLTQEQLQAALDGNAAAVANQIQGMNRDDLMDQRTMLGDIQGQLTALNARPQAQQVDLSSITNRLDQMAQPQQVDLSGIMTRLDQMEAAQPSFDINQISSMLDERLAGMPQPQGFDYDRIGSMIDQRVSNIPQVDLSGLQSQINGLNSQVQQGFASIPQPGQVDLSGLQQQIAGLGNQMSQGFASIPQPGQVDLSGLQQQIAGLGNQVQQGFSAIPQQQSVDLSGLQRQLDSLGGKVQQGFASIPQAPSIDYGRINEMMSQQIGQIPQTDLSGLQSQLSGLGNQMSQGFASIPQAPSIDYGRINQMVQGAAPDLSGLQQQMTGLSNQFGGFGNQMQQGFANMGQQIGQMPTADLSPILDQLAGLEQLLANPTAPSAPVAPGFI